MFRGEWYFINIFYNIEDSFKIDNWYNNLKIIVLINDMIKNKYIKKVVYVYDENRNFLFKYDGVIDV